MSNDVKPSLENALRAAFDAGWTACSKTRRCDPESFNDDSADEAWEKCAIKKTLDRQEDVEASVPTSTFGSPM